MIQKHGSAHWTGGLQDGKGVVSTESGVLDKVAYVFAQRFEDAAGSNPEELIGAAHAACYSMALANVLGDSGITPEDIDTRSTVSLDMSDGPRIASAHLDVTIKSEGDAEKIREAAKAAEQGCPVSALLDCEITSEVTLT